MKYEIEIEKFDEEFEIIDEVNTLEEAKKIAKDVSRETYKAISINELDKNERVIKVHCLEE